MAQLDGVSDVVSVSPVIFLGSAAFALLTVFLSCARPGRMAAKVSPVEAVRYTEGAGKGRKERKSRKGFSLAGMAWANLGRKEGQDGDHRPLPHPGGGAAEPDGDGGPGV